MGGGFRELRTLLAHGVDLSSALFEILITGRAPSIELPWTARRHCSVQFLGGEPGEELAGADPLAVYELPGVLLAEVFLEPGERVPEMRSSHDRIGVVLAGGPDSASARARTEAAAAALAANLEFVSRTES